jgi:hypothetical protein
LLQPLLFLSIRETEKEIKKAMKEVIITITEVGKKKQKGHSDASKRKSPAQSATLGNEGDMGRGIDGNIWIIKKNKNGVQRWVRT